MKKFLTLIVSSFFSVVAISQTLTFDLGTSYSKLNWNYIDVVYYEKHYKAPLISYSMSAGYEYLKNKYWSIKSDLSLYKTGGKYSSEELDANYTFISPHKISLDYLSAGTYFNFYPLNTKFKIMLTIGPRVDYIVNGIKNPPFKWIDSYNGINKFNWGYSTGISFYYELKKSVIGLNSRMLFRIKKLADLTPKYNPEHPGATAKEQVILLGVSYGYNFK